MSLSISVLAEHVEYLLGLLAVLHGLSPHGLGQLLIGDLYVIRTADFGQHQTQTDPTLGNLAVLDLKLVVRLLSVLGRQTFAFLVLLDLRPDLAKLSFNHLGRQRKHMLAVQHVKQGTLQLKLRSPSILTFQIGLQKLTQLL